MNISLKLFFITAYTTWTTSLYFQPSLTDCKTGNLSQQKAQSFQTTGKISPWKSVEHNNIAAHCIFKASSNK